MPNPILKNTAPGFASIRACFWVSNQIESAPGVFAAGAWDAKNAVFYPAWGGPSPIACGASGRNGLKISGLQGIDLATTNGHTNSVVDLAGPEIVILAVSRKSAATSQAIILQNCDRFGSQRGIQMSMSSTSSVAARANEASSQNAAFSTTGAVSGQLRAYWYRRSEQAAPMLYIDGAGTASAGGQSTPFVYDNIERRAGIGNFGSQAALAATEHDTYMIVVWDSDDWMQASPNASMQVVGSSEAQLLAGSFYDAFLQFVSAPVITDQPDNATVTDGQPATFTVAFTGAPTPTVQWRRNGVDIAGATNATYTFTATLADNGAQYTARIVNSEGNATSTAATLTVNAIVGGTITSNPLVRNTGAAATDPWALWAPGEAFTAWVHHRTTGALLVKRTGLLTNAAGVVTFTDPAVPVAAAYRVDYEHEATGVLGVEVRPAT
jgi:hypothetical protein